MLISPRHPKLSPLCIHSIIFSSVGSKGCVQTCTSFELPLQSLTYLCLLLKATTFFKSFKMIRVQIATFFVNGVVWEMRKLEESNLKRCQNQMQSVNSNVCFLRRRGIHGRPGNRNKTSKSNLADSSRWISYCCSFHHYRIIFFTTIYFPGSTAQLVIMLISMLESSLDVGTCRIME